MTEQQALQMLNDREYKWGRINPWTICIWMKGRKLGIDDALLVIMKRGGFRPFTYSYDAMTDTTKFAFRSKRHEDEPHGM